MKRCSPVVTHTITDMTTLSSDECCHPKHRLMQYSGFFYETVLSGFSVMAHRVHLSEILDSARREKDKA